MIHIPSLSSASDIYFSDGTQLVSLFTNKALTVIFFKYANFVNIFFPEFIVKLLEHTEIKNHPISRVDIKQLSYEPIYSLRPV